MTYRGTLYGLPLNFKVITLIYNKKLVASAARRPPPSWSGVGEEAHRQGGRQVRPRLGLRRLLLPRLAAERLRRRGLRPRQQADAQRPGERQGARAADEAGTRPASCRPSRRSALITSLFNEGKAAMVFSGPWFLGEIAPGRRLRPGAAARHQRGGRQAHAALDDGRGRLHRGAVEEEGGGLRVREVPDRRRGGQGAGAGGALHPGGEGGLRRPRGGPGRPDLLVPEAGRGGGADAQRARDDHGLVAGHHRAQQDQRRGLAPRTPSTSPRRRSRRTSPGCARASRWARPLHGACASSSAWRWPWRWGSAADRWPLRGERSSRSRSWQVRRGDRPRCWRWRRW